jgi:hypothetical protein
VRTDELRQWGDCGLEVSKKPFVDYGELWKGLVGVAGGPAFWCIALLFTITGSDGKRERRSGTEARRPRGRRLWLLLISEQILCRN